MWVGDQAAANNQLNYHNIGEEILLKRVKRVSSTTYLLFIFFFYMSAEFKSSSILR